MTDKQWNELKAVIDGQVLAPLPVGFIIDSPWLPNWYGIDILDYFESGELWLKANMKALEEFPEAMFLPGFWAEYGMCSEPSAFGARSSFPRNEFPHAFPMLRSPEEIAQVEVPDAEKDGFGPLMLKRLELAREKMEASGHKIRFSVSRGPMNIASFMMGTTEFMMALMTHPDECKELIRKISDYLAAWHDLQKQYFPTIDGILMLDDIIGFVSGEQFEEFGLPYFKKLYDRELSVKFLHNDASCTESLRFLPEMGVNLFNMAFDTDLNELKRQTNDQVTMLGNLPPRDVLAAGTPDQVREASRAMVNELEDRSRVIFSCGGGMPPGVSSENIRAFIQGVQGS